MSLLDVILEAAEHAVSDSERDIESPTKRRQYFEEAASNGFYPVVPNSNCCQIDIDNESQYNTFMKNRAVISRNCGWEPELVSDEASRTKGHRHITVRMPFVMNDEERILWQALLGSDPTRELLSLLRSRRGLEMPIIFMEKLEETN